MDTPSSDNDLFMLDNDLPPYSKEPQLSLWEAAMENENFGELASTFSEVELEYLNVLHDLDSSRSIKPLSDAIFMIKDPRESAKLPEEMEAISSDDGESISEVECPRIKNQMKKSKSKNVAQNKVRENNPAQSCSRRQSPIVLGTPEYSLRKRNCKITLAIYDKSKRKKLQTAKPPKRLQPKRGKTIAPAQAQSPIQMEENDNREPEKVHADADSPQSEIANVTVKAKTPAQKKKKMGRLASSEKRNTVRGRPGINDKILSNAGLNGITSANQLIRQHSNGKYQCTFCRRNFPNRANLIIHLRIHTGERPYECNQCSESFKQLCHVQQHSKNIHQREIGKDDVTFTPGRLEALLLNPNRKLGRPVVYATVTSKRICSSKTIKQTRIPKPGKPVTPPTLELDPELLEVMDNDNDENESEKELIASNELKNHIKDTNLQNSFYRPQFFRMTQGDGNNNKSVEVDANLLMYFIRPFFQKSGVNCPEDLLEVHSDLRRMSAIQDEKEEETQKEVKTETVKSNDAKLPIRKKKVKPLLNPKKNLKSALLLCTYCDMKFTSPYYHRKHISENHGSLKCGECAMNFLYRARLRTHMATHISSENAGDGNNEFHFCSNCKLAYASAEKLRIHIQTHTTNSNSIVDVGAKKQMKNPFRSNDAKLPLRKKKLKPLSNPKKNLKSASALVSCKHCDMKFTTIHHLRKHMSKIHVSLKCGECSMNFQYRGRLRTHMATHTSSENFADGNNEFHFCSNCKLAYASAEKLQIHIQTHNTNPIIKKTSTKEEEKNPVKPKTAMEKAKKSGVKKKPIVFNKSAAQYSENLLQAHLNLENTSEIPDEKDPENEIKNENKNNDKKSKLGSSKKLKIAPLGRSLHSCKNCGMKFTGKFHLRKHVAENHGNFKCGECVKSFQQRQPLRAHMISNHTSENANGANDFHFCKICKLAYASAEGLQLHVQSHDFKPKVVVPKSKINGEKKKVPKSKSKVKVSEEKDAEGNPPLPTQKKTILKKESKISLEKFSSIKKTVPRKPSNENIKKARPLVKKRMTCATCGDQFLGRDKLEEHMKSHGHVRARPHTCSVCGKGFFDTHTLKQHMQTHSVAKFECKLCGARLGRQASLRIHLLRHTGEFKFECKHCARKFIDRGNYTRHLAVHEGKELIKCPCCDASFANKQGYHFHMKDIHPEVYRKQKKEKVPSVSATSVPVPPVTGYLTTTIE